MKIIKFYKKNLVMLVTLLVLFKYSLSENIQNKKTEVETQQQAFYANNQYMLPTNDMRSHEMFIQGVPQQNQMRMIPTMAKGCPCASQIRCRPCDVLANPMSNPMDYLPPVIGCPCAPRLNCPVCPPLSLIHEVASKKVIYYN